MTRRAKSRTQENIRLKRKEQAHRRRIRRARLIVLMFFLGIFIAVLAVAGYFLYGIGHGIYQEIDAVYQGYEERRQVRDSHIDAKFDGYTNVLILGIDDGADENGTEGKHADTILLLSMENATGSLRAVTVPPNMIVSLPQGGGELRATDLYAHGGAPTMVQTLSALLGVSIHQYVTLDTQALAELVDVLGGVDLYVEDEMNYDDPEAGLSIRIPKGFQHMDGDTAQKYLRYRSSELGEVGRLHRQQRFAKALYEKFLQVDTIPKLPDVADIFKYRMTTSAEIFDSARLAKVLKNLGSAPPKTLILPTSQHDGYWLPDRGAIRQKIEELFPELVKHEGENDDNK